VANSDATVLITGESGTGKELVARAIHESSRRRNGLFVPINCSSFSPDLVENELFGHSRGSFTGATESTPGIFEFASGGTLFLDEISTMPLYVQPRLLRVLQEKKVRRIGEAQERPVNTRIIAASNQDLLDLVRQNKFRSDLFYRLNVFRINIPSLAKRKSDIPLIARHILQRLNRENNTNKRFMHQSLELLKNYLFPGNVRELENKVHSLFITCPPDGIIYPEAVKAELEGRLPDSDRVKSESLAEEIFEQLVTGEKNFREAVRDPFMRRDISRREVRKIISLGLRACDGSYFKLTTYFGLEQSEYKRFLSFLQNHGCKVDFRPYRQ
jgi:two-component system response regulator AtoC